MQNAFLLRAAMAQLGLSQKDLATLLGSRPRASEILHGKRGISTAQVLKLHQAWGIPLHTLLNPKAPTQTLHPDQVTEAVQAALARFDALRTHRARTKA